MHYVFGTADGALFALHAAISLTSIIKYLILNPLLFVGQPWVEEFKELLNRFEKKMDEVKLAEAMVVLTKGANIKFINYLIPDFILEEVFKLYIWNEDRKASGGDVS